MTHEELGGVGYIVSNYIYIAIRNNRTRSIYKNEKCV